MSRLLRIVALALALACASRSSVPQGAASGVISLQAIDCQSCGVDVVAALQGQPGVHAVAFDRELAEVAVQFDPTRTNMDALLAVVAEQGYAARVGAGQGSYVPEIAFDEALDVETIATDGRAVDLEQHLAPGKVTVFDFYAPWCKPCREIDHHMKAVLDANDDVALRKIDIADWDSPVVAQHMRGVSELPYVVVHGRSGKQVARISGLALDRLDQAIAKARHR